MEWNGMEWLLQPTAVSSLLGVGLSHCASRLATQTHAVTTRSVGPARSMALAMQSLRLVASGEASARAVCSCIEGSVALDRGCGCSAWQWGHGPQSGTAAAVRVGLPWDGVWLPCWAVGSWPTVKHGSCIGSRQVLGSPQSYAGAGEGGVQYLWLVIGVLWTVID